MSLGSKVHKADPVRNKLMPKPIRKIHDAPMRVAEKFHNTVGKVTAKVHKAVGLEALPTPNQLETSIVHPKRAPGATARKKTPLSYDPSMSIAASGRGGSSK